MQSKVMRMKAKIKRGSRSRFRRTPSHRWSDAETYELLVKIRNVLINGTQKFEKPTSQIFYDIIKKDSPELQCITWLSMKGKMRHSKTLWLTAKKLKNQEEAGLINSVRGVEILDYITKMCPNYDLLEEIFSQFVELPDDYLMNFHSEFQTSFEKNYADESVYSIPAMTADEENTTKPIQYDRDELCMEDVSIELPESYQSSVQKEEDNEEQHSENQALSVMSMLISMQKQIINLEKKKLDWQIEKEKHHLLQRYKLKKLIIERDERLQREKFMLESQLEEKLKTYELDLKYKKIRH